MKIVPLKEYIESKYINKREAAEKLDIAYGTLTKLLRREECIVEVETKQVYKKLERRRRGPFKCKN